MVMLAKIQEISESSARRVLGSELVERTLAEQTIDSLGADAFRVVVVLKPQAVREMTGDQTLDVLAAIRSDLAREGEERLAIVEYATEEDLKIEDEPAGDAVSNPRPVEDED